MDAIIDAAVDLYAGRNPDEVTVRDIAERAGVSHALVHHYFGTKSEVLRAVLDRNAEGFHTKVDWTLPAERGAVEVFRAALDSRDYALAILRSSVDGKSPEELQDGFPTMDQLIEVIKRRDPADDLPIEKCDPRVAAVVLVAFVFGWMATENWLLQAAGIGEDDVDDVHSQIECVLRAIVRMAEIP